MGRLLQESRYDQGGWDDRGANGKYCWHFAIILINPPSQGPAQPQQAPAAAAAPGAPDYSAQWAEYYRSMGKTKEAEQIEAQIRAKNGGGAPAQPQAYGGQQQQQYYPPQQVSYLLPDRAFVTKFLLSGWLSSSLKT